MFLLLLFCSRLSADAEPTPEEKFAGELIASDRWQDLLTARKGEVTKNLCDRLSVEGKSLRSQGEFQSALKAYTIGQAVAGQIDDKACLALAVRGIGIVESIQGDETSALQQYEKSLAIAREINDRALIAGALRSIGIHYLDVGDDETAMEHFQQSLAISEEMNDVKSMLPTMLNLGVLNVDNGNFSEGLRYYTKMLSHKELEGSKDLLASTYNNIAIVYDYQGDTQQALEFYEKAMAIRREMGDKANIANLLNNMGDARLLGNEDRALENNKEALAMAEEVGDKASIARCLASIGGAYRRKGDYAQALEFSTRALQLAGEIKDQEIVTGQLRQIARIYIAKAQYQEALDYSTKAAASARQIHSRQDLWNSMEIQGQAYRALHQPEEARAAFDEAIATIEDWSSYVAGGEVEKLSQFAEKASVYYEMIDFLVEQNQVPAALQYAERMKARALLEVLHSGRVEIAGAMSREEIDEEKRLKQQIVGVNEKMEGANAAPALSGQLQAARLEFESFRTKLYVNHPELKVSRGESSPISLADVANQLDPGTTILEYAVTETKTFLFVLSQRAGKLDTNVYVIPVRQKELEERVRNFRLQIAERDLRIQSTARDMFKLLLSPAAKEIPPGARLMLIPDDCLWEMAFQALQSPAGRYILQDHPVDYAPSMTVYYEMRRLHPEEGGAAPTLLAFGNPDIGKTNTGRLGEVYRDEKLVPLPEAEKEVNALKTLYGTKRSKVFTGTQAREEFLKKDAANFSILHFATHGILNDTTPLYSQILLTRGDSAAEDGLLEAWEIMNLNLKADLVVLSACDTALGRVRHGEGMIGLAWAFFIAGAPATVVSQWKVASASTTELMLDFHKQLQSKAARVSTAEALRQAALHLMQNDSYRHPFYWAPFVVIGYGLDAQPAGPR